MIEDDYSVDGISIYSEEAKEFHERITRLQEKYKIDKIREKLIDIILKVAMAHHDDISKSDEDAACDAADEILKEFSKIFLLEPKIIKFIEYLDAEREETIKFAEYLKDVVKKLEIM